MKKIIALETTETHGSIAAFEEGTLIFADKLQEKSAKSLAPAISEMLKKIGWKSAEINFVAVAVGPGSFTGLRVGVATAKVFAYATGAKVVGIDTLRAAAYSFLRNADEKSRSRFSVISSAVDAQRSEVVCQNFSANLSDSGELLVLTEPKLVSVRDWLEQKLEQETEQKLEQETVRVGFTGPALFRVIKEKVPLPEKFHVKHCNEILDEAFWNPDAIIIGQLAMQRIQRGESDDIWTLSPIYSRPSAAEEKFFSPGHQSANKFGVWS